MGIARHVLTVLVLMLGCPGCRQGYDDGTPRIPVIAVFDAAPELVEPQILEAIFADGEVVVSASSLGGPPYRSASLPVSSVAKTLERITEYSKQKGITEPSWGYIGPDMAYRTIWVAYDRFYLELVSMHEFIKSDSDLVATEHGLQALDGRSRADVFAGQSEVFKRFMREWDFDRQEIRVLVALAGKSSVVNVTFESKAGAAGQTQLMMRRQMGTRVGTRVTPNVP